MGSKMILDISWNNLNKQSWDSKFQAVSRAPITQSHEYALAAAKIYGQRPRWGVISVDGTEAGLVQLMEAGILAGLIHAVIIDCGPLWFDGFGKVDHVHAFWREINRQFPARLGRKRRFIPAGGAREGLIGAGLKPRENSQAYETIWLDLTKDIDDLRAGLKKNWRGVLNKAERHAERGDLTVQWDDTGALLPWFLQIYAIDKAARQYRGASAKFLRHLGHSFAAKHGMIGGVMIGRALDTNGEPVAGVMIPVHGGSATYQAGWCGDKGREMGAQNLLLWQGLEKLKDRGIRDFDLGGINEESAKGVKTFKEGLLGKNANGEIVTFSGIYA